ncbi:MAG: MBL fold metallo-hydrolase, partial [Actinomycetes bacterium]
MRLTKYTHACVRLEKDGQVLVVDPGEWSEPEVLEGASAVLVTHEHFDHVDPELLVAAQTGNPALVVHTNAAVVAQLADAGVRAVAVAPGDTFDAAGFSVLVVGGEHAEVYDGLPGCANVGFVIDGDVYHPGDAMFVPDVRVETLLVPVSGPWLKLAEAIDFVCAVQPRRAFP